MNSLKSLVIISLLTIFSRILGFIRDSVIACIFGVEMTTDAFLVAFKLPNLLRRIFAEGAFLQAFVPILSEYKKDGQNEEEIRAFIANISGLLILIVSIITVIGILISPWIIVVIAPGFSRVGNKFVLITQLLRIVFPYILLISLASLAGALLNIWGCFFVSAFAPSFLNISMIVFAIFATPYFNPPILALAWSVIIGGILQLTYQLPFLKKKGVLVLPKINLYNAGTMRVVKKMGPAILGSSVSQISTVINTVFSSYLVSGSTSWTYYADRLIELPMGVLGSAIVMILLPSLSKNFSSGNCDKYNCLMDWGLRLCFLFALPSTVSFIILVKPLTISLFQYGKFTTFDAVMTQHTLIGYSIGLIGMILVKVLSSGFYSCQNMKTPLRIAIFTLIATQLMNVLFIKILKHVGLSLSIGLASYLNAALLYWELRKQKIFTPKLGWRSFFFRLLIAVVTMAGILLGVLHIMPEWSIGTMLSRLIRLVSVVFLGVVIYFLMLFLLGFKIKEFTRFIL